MILSAWSSNLYGYEVLGLHMTLLNKFTDRKNVSSLPPPLREMIKICSQISFRYNFWNGIKNSAIFVIRQSIKTYFISPRKNWAEMPEVCGVGRLLSILTDCLSIALELWIAFVWLLLLPFCQQSFQGCAKFAQGCNKMCNASHSEKTSYRHAYQITMWLPLDSF